MRLDEWQKWLDSQFLDAEKDSKARQPEQPAASSEAVPEETPSFATRSEASALPAEPTPAAASEPSTPVTASLPGAPADEMEVPSIERYLPFLRPREAAQPASEPEIKEEHPSLPELEPAVHPADMEVAETPVEAMPTEAKAPAEAPAETDSYAVEASAVPPETGARAKDSVPPTETVPAQPERSSPAVGGRRFGISHRRARHARNVIPQQDPESVSAPELWKLVPKHIQVLVAMGSDEIAQNSYKRAFRESRLELIHRLLDPTLSLEDTARLLNVCPTTVRRYTNKGLLTHQRTAGDQRRFRLSDVLAFLEAQSQVRREMRK
jgi:excisionase family DNA binding protein